MNILSIKLPKFLLKMDKHLAMVKPSLFIKKPLFLIRAAWKVASMKFFGGDKLVGVNFATHYHCNLKCEHCYEETIRKDKPIVLEKEERIKVIEKLINFGVLNITFVGGEATMDKNLPDYIKACRPYKTYINIATNAYAFSREKVRELKRLGVDKLIISIDSWFEEEHDKFRGRPGAYRSVFQTIDYCKEVDMDVALTTVVFNGHTKSVSFNKLVEYAVAKNIRLQFKPALPSGGWQGDYEKLITKEDVETMDQLMQKYPLLTRDSKKGCPAFQYTITVTASGDVMACNAINSSFGNLKNEDIKSILKKGRSIKYFDGTFPGCPPSEDKHFIESVVTRTFDSGAVPRDYKYVFENELNKT